MNPGDSLWDCPSKSTNVAARQVKPTTEKNSYAFGVCLKRVVATLEIPNKTGFSWPTAPISGLGTTVSRGATRAGSHRYQALLAGDHRCVVP